MRPENKSKRETGRSRRTHRTKDDFLRWLKKKDARQKQVTQAKITQAERLRSAAEGIRSV